MQNRIPQNIIDQVLAEVSIKDVVESYVTLKKRGASWICLCPFHSDRTPSMYVSPTKGDKGQGICKCFACGAGGDVINFVKQIEGISYGEAVRRLAKEKNIAIPDIEMTDEEKAREHQREAAYIALDAADKQFQSNLKNSPATQTYLHQTRSQTDETIDLYHIGFAQNDNQLVKEFAKRSYSFEVLTAAGLVGQTEKQYQYDRFRERVMLPFLDLSGKVIGFSGRYIGEDTEQAKYVNTPDTMLFSKGKNLFGLFQARKYIVSADKAYIVEGHFDVTSFSQYGIKNTVGSSGTAFTDDQVRLLQRFTTRVVLVFDGDSAGAKATLKSIKSFLAFGFDVKGFIMPKGEDPDSFARKTGAVELPQKLLAGEIGFIDLIKKLCETDKDSAFDTAKILDEVCTAIAGVPDKAIKKLLIGETAKKFKGISQEEIRDRIKPKKELKIEDWKDGFYGIEEAADMIAENEDSEIARLTFDQEVYMQSFGESPVVYCCGVPGMSDIQMLRSKLGKVEILESMEIMPTLRGEPEKLQVLLSLFKENVDISVVDPDSETGRLFPLFYVYYSGMVIKADTTGIIRERTLDKCIEVIACTNQTSRTANASQYADSLGITKGTLDKMLKPLLAKRKDKAEFEIQCLTDEANLMPFDPSEVPDYVINDPLLSAQERRYGFYPLLDKNLRPIAYMFKNQQGGSYSAVSDFCLEPLLHVEDGMGGNKRVVKLTHTRSRFDRYLELPSEVFASLQTLKINLVKAGGYNFFGSSNQYSTIWQPISYGFTNCKELKVFGQHHDKDFFAFSNAIFHQVDGKYKIDYMNDLGVAEHDGESFYSPASSCININNREDNTYKQANNIRYKEIMEKDRLSFTEWADLMNRVYCTNENGQWSILFAITSAFRDFIMKYRGSFTALFFIGPTGSGKTQVAESVRNLFMNSNTPSFNLNTGTDASFFMILETLRNIVILMEEYNENQISDAKFQGLKSATLDGEGKIKVKDIGSKTMDSSDINAALIILGQEAAQKDDGALSNRCILCDVPYRATEFTEDEIAIYERLKKHERIGLCNILIDILSLRPIFEKHYLAILAEETKNIKDSVRVEVTNTEGLSRIINAVALHVATCRLMETYAPEMKLPFTYEEFFKTGCKKVLSQLDRISSSNKLSTYFNTINTLLTDRIIISGREFKISTMDKVSVKQPGNKTESLSLGVPTKVLYLDFTAIYPKYKRLVGEKEAMSEQSLRNYFASNKAFIGLCKSTLFKWEEAVQQADGRLISNTEEGKEFEARTDNTVRVRMESKNKQSSAYMFNYEILSTLLDIDFERTDRTDSALPF
ncbi:DNA primase [Dysgonomonas capnocytophagoides]|uniref:DNA primase n=1 Tax=Dysgonomonas capnocytophagoides TaxID=45254 RepID=A0A4Y8KZS3_9BACT|nr:DNA primase [Dysgonomonas capnocytophagoides]TFD95511.1 DNA primase [Dysgonomonas capnocytophagoides]